MVKRILLSVVLLILAVFFATPLQAADPQDVAKVVRLMKNPATKGVIERKTYPNGGIRIVFVVKKKKSRDMRYTFHYTGNGERPWLSVWIRPNGTSDQNNLETFTDHGLDGIVDLGMGPNRYMYFDRKLGEESHGYWQLCYDAAIKAALKKLK